MRVEGAMAVIVVGDEVTSSLRFEEDSLFLSSLSINNYIDQHHLSHQQQYQQHGLACKYRRPHIATLLTHRAKLRYYFIIINNVHC